MASLAISTPSAPVAASTKRVVFMDGMRALAIMGVVCTHAHHLHLARPQNDPLALGWISNVLHNGTVVFVFVAGFLFAHLMRPDWSFLGYLKTKSERVVAPYLVATALLLFMQVPADAWNFELASRWITRGSAGLSLWFIPFVTLIYVVAPAFLVFMRARPNTRLVVLVAALALGLLVHRPIQNVDKIQALAYFGFFYLFGVEASLRAHQFSEAVRGYTRCAVLGLALMVACAIEGHFMGFWGSYGDWFADKPFNLRYPSNILLILFLASACVTFPALNTGLMRRFADDSFGIFFVHNIVLLLAIKQFGKVNISGLYVIDTLICSALIFLGSWILVLGVKAASGRHARWLVGA